MAIGVFLILISIFIMEYTPQVILPIAEMFGMTSQVENRQVVVPTTLVNVAALNYSYLSSSLEPGTEVAGAFQVTGGGAVAFYLMDEGNFTAWRAGRPSQVVLVKALATSYNFTFSPSAQGTYYFVFDNQEASRLVVIFSLTIIQNKTVLSPILDYSGYLLFVVGIALAAIGIKTGKKAKPKAVIEEAQTQQTGWACRFCGANNQTDEIFCAKCGRSQT